jgi:hypothetical protein
MVEYLCAVQIVYISGHTVRVYVFPCEGIFLGRKYKVVPFGFGGYAEAGIAVLVNCMLLNIVLSNLSGNRGDVRSRGVLVTEHT